MVLGTLNIPNVIVTLLEKTGAKRPFGMTVPEVAALYLSDEAIQTRLRLLMDSLRPGKTPGGRE